MGVFSLRGVSVRFPWHSDETAALHNHLFWGWHLQTNPADDPFAFKDTGTEISPSSSPLPPGWQSQERRESGKRERRREREKKRLNETHEWKKKRKLRERKTEREKQKNKLWHIQKAITSKWTAARNWITAAATDGDWTISLNTAPNQSLQFHEPQQNWNIHTIENEISVRAKTVLFRPLASTVKVWAKVSQQRVNPSLWRWDGKVSGLLPQVSTKQYQQIQ